MKAKTSGPGKITRKEFVRKAAIGAAAVGSVAMGLSKNARAQAIPGGTTTVYPDYTLQQIRDAIDSHDVVLFSHVDQNGSPMEYVLEDSVQDGAVLEITKPVALRALDEINKPVLLVKNTAFDTNLQNFTAHAIRVTIPEGTPKRNVSFKDLIINGSSPDESGRIGRGYYRGLDVIACDDCDIVNCEIYTDPLFPNFPAGESYLDGYGGGIGTLHIGADIRLTSSSHKISGNVRIKDCFVSGPIGIDFGSTSTFFGGTPIDGAPCVTDITANVMVTGCHIISYTLRGIGAGGDQDILWNNGNYTVRGNKIEGGVQGFDSFGILWGGIPTVWGGLAGRLDFSGNELTVNGYVFGFVGSAIEIEHTKQDSFSGFFNDNIIHMNCPPPRDADFLSWSMPIFSTDVGNNRPTYNVHFNNNTIDGPCPVDVMLVADACHDCEYKNFNRGNMTVPVPFTVDWLPFPIQTTLLFAVANAFFFGHTDYALGPNRDFTDQSTGNTIIDNYKPVAAVVIDLSDPNMGSPDYAGQNTLKGNLRKAYNVAGNKRVPIPGSLLARSEKAKKQLGWRARQ